MLVLRNSLYSLGSQIIVKIVSFTFLIFVVRELGRAEYGKYAIATAFVGALMVMADLGIGSYVSREVSRDITQIPQLLANMIGIRFVLALVFIAIATTGAWLLGYPSDIIFAIFLGSASQLLFAVQSSIDAVFIGSQRLGRSALAATVNQLVMAATGVSLLLLGAGFHGVVIAALCGIIAATTINVLAMRHKLDHIWLHVKPRTWLFMVRRGLPFGINQFALSLTYRLDSLMLGWFWGDSVVGMYTAAYNLIFTLATISNSINLALFPHMSREYSSQPDVARRKFGRYLQFLLIVSLPMATIGTVLADQITQFLFANKYPESAIALRILVWSLPLMYLNELLGYIAATVGQEKRMAQLRMVNAASNVLLNCAAIPLYGLIGASVTTVLTEMIGIIQFVWLFRRREIFPAEKSWVLYPVCAAVAAMLSAVVLHTLPVIVAGACALLVYGVGLVATGAVKKDEVRAVFIAANTREFARVLQKQGVQ